MTKPIVHYSKLFSAYVGGSAYVHGVTDHPNHLEGHAVSNDPKKTITTTQVIAYDETTGRIETKNTVYMPLVRTSGREPTQPLSFGETLMKRAPLLLAAVLATLFSIPAPAQPAGYFRVGTTNEGMSMYLDGHTVKKVFFGVPPNSQLLVVANTWSQQHSFVKLGYDCQRKGQAYEILVTPTNVMAGREVRFQEGSVGFMSWGYACAIAHGLADANGNVRGRQF